MGSFAVLLVVVLSLLVAFARQDEVTRIDDLTARIEALEGEMSMGVRIKLRDGGEIALWAAKDPKRLRMTVVPDRENGETELFMDEYYELLAAMRALTQ